MQEELIEEYMYKAADGRTLKVRRRTRVYIDPMTGREMTETHEQTFVVEDDGTETPLKAKDEWDEVFLTDDKGNQSVKRVRRKSVALKSGLHRDETQEEEYRIDKDGKRILVKRSRRASHVDGFVVGTQEVYAVGKDGKPMLVSQTPTRVEKQPTLSKQADVRRRLTTQGISEEDVFPLDSLTGAAVEAEWGEPSPAEVELNKEMQSTPRKPPSFNRHYFENLDPESQAMYLKKYIRILDHAQLTEG